LLRDKNKQLEDLRDKKTARTVKAITGFVCFWFGTILFLYLLLQVFVVPTLKRVNHSTADLELTEVASPDKEIYLLGLSIPFPPAGMSSQSVVPSFDNHRLNLFSIFLASGKRPVGAMIVNVDPDDLSTHPAYSKLYIPLLTKGLLFDDSVYDFIETMHRTQLSDFSWWNLIYDTRVVYVLVCKAIYTPVFFVNGQTYFIKTPHLHGIYAEGKYNKDRYIKELTFRSEGFLYTVTLVDKIGNDFRDCVAGIRVVSAAEADQIINGYAVRRVATDLELAANLSRNVTPDGLEQLLGLIEKRKAAGEKSIKDTGSIQAELARLKGF
jgi:hypothetical protein